MKLTSGQPLDAIVLSCRKIVAYCAPLTRETFLEQSYWQESVALNIIFVGEALIDIRRRDHELFDRLDAAHEIIGLRHRIVHGYRKVDLARLWQYAREDVPVIGHAAETLLSEYFAEHGPNPDLTAMDD